MQHNHGAPPHAEDEEDWLMSYADMVTLLLCFFVMFFDPQKSDKKDEQQLPQNNGVVQLIADSFGAALKDDTRAPSATGQAATDEKMMDDVKENIDKKLSTLNKSEIAFELNKLNSTDILLRVWSEGMFSSGSAVLSKTGHELVTRVAGTLTKFSGKVEIRIEGHTDSRNMRVGSKIKNNLVLSSMRAASTASVFLEESEAFNEKDVTLIGSGAKNLLVPDVDAKNNFIASAADKNRRIDIYIVSKPMTPEEAKAAAEAAKAAKAAAGKEGDKAPASEKPADGHAAKEAAPSAH